MLFVEQINPRKAKIQTKKTMKMIFLVHLTSSKGKIRQKLNLEMTRRC